MAGPASPYDESPARLSVRAMPAAEPWTGLATERIELLSRGDIVTGVRARPATGRDVRPVGGSPALMLLHDAGSHASGVEWRPIARWLTRGVQALSIDLPLHGLRASPKLTERLLGALAALEQGSPLDRNGGVLADEALRQAHHDAARTLDALLALDGIDPKRIGLLGIGLGAGIAEALLEDDRRPAAAVLVRTRIEPATRPASRTRAHPDAAGVLRLDATIEPRGWVEEAERFFASRLAFPVGA